MSPAWIWSEAEAARAGRDTALEGMVFRFPSIQLLGWPPYADVAQLVEHNLAKVGVAGSNPVVRSRSEALSGASDSRSGPSIGRPSRAPDPSAVAPGTSSSMFGIPGTSRSGGVRDRPASSDRASAMALSRSAVACW